MFSLCWKWEVTFGHGNKGILRKDILTDSQNIYFKLNYIFMQILGIVVYKLVLQREVPKRNLIIIYN